MMTGPLNRRILFLILGACAISLAGGSVVRAAPDLPIEQLVGTTVMVLLRDGAKIVGILSPGSSERKVGLHSAGGIIPLSADQIRDIKQVPLDMQQRAALVGCIVELKDGSLFQGELVSFHPDKDLLLKLATASVERIPVTQVHQMYSSVSISDRPAPASSFLHRRILLRDGSILVAELIAFIPNFRLVVRTATGEIRTYSRDDVLVVEAPKTLPQKQAAVSPQGHVKTYLAAPDGFALQRKSEEVFIEPFPESSGPVIGRSSIAAAEIKQVHGEWRALCGAPCGLWLSASDTYRVAGGELTGQPFHIHPSTAPAMTLTASVRKANPPLIGGGSMLVVGGGLTSLGGLTVFLLKEGWSDSALAKIGAVPWAVGLSVVVAGALMIRRGQARILLTQKPGEPDSK
jgi:small nuclear ribonucleoprotein (snRNP)-like protein